MKNSINHALEGVVFQTPSGPVMYVQVAPGDAKLIGLHGNRQSDEVNPDTSGLKSLGRIRVKKVVVETVGVELVNA